MRVRYLKWLDSLGLFPETVQGPVLRVVRERVEPMVAVLASKVDAHRPLKVQLEEAAVNAYLQGFSDCYNNVKDVGSG